MRSIQVTNDTDIELLADAYLMTGAFIRAGRTFMRSSQLDARLLYRAGWAFNRGNSWDEAYDALQQSLELKELPSTYYEIALALARNDNDHHIKGDRHTAIYEALSKAATLPGNYASTFLWLADLCDYHDFGVTINWETRRTVVVPAKIKILEDGLLYHQENVDIRVALARLHVKWTNNYMAAHEVLQPLDGIEIQYSPYLWYAFEAERMLGNTEKAGEYLQRFIDLYPTNKHLSIAMGHLLCEQGDYQGAISQYESAVMGADSREVTIAAHAGLSNAHLHIGNIVEASNQIAQAVDALLNQFPPQSHMDLDLLSINLPNVRWSTDFEEYNTSPIIDHACRNLIPYIRSLGDDDLVGRLLYVVYTRSDGNDITPLLEAAKLSAHPMIGYDVIRYCVNAGEWAEAIHYHLAYHEWYYAQFSRDPLFYSAGPGNAPFDSNEITKKKDRRSIHKVCNTFLQQCTNRDVIENVYRPFYREFWRGMLLKGAMYKELFEVSSLFVRTLGDVADELFDKALASHYLENYDQAIAVYERVIAISPTFTSAQYNLALILVSRNDIARADTLVTNLLDIDPENSNYIKLRNQIAAKVAEQQAERNRLETIRRVFSVDRVEPIDIHDLSLTQAVYLLSLVRVGGSEDFELVMPSSGWHMPLSPHDDFDSEILRLLKSDDKLIGPDWRSPGARFKLEDNGSVTYYLNEVRWLLHLGQNAPENGHIIARLEGIFASGDWPMHWYEQWYPLWRVIALNECIAYLLFQLEEHRLSFSPGEKTRLLFDRMLDTFSIGQCFYFIWSGARAGAAYLQRTGVPPKQAANYVIGDMQRKLERALNEKWDIDVYHRPAALPESMLSRVFFQSVLKIGMNGFEDAITPDYPIGTFTSL